MNQKYTNRLKLESSPYLKSHAHNPVDWYAWGEEAFAKAKAENKPILLSIGYSSCHWCHVMEHECFNNEDIARVQNENFVSIKLDREERPDLDEIYMNAVQMLTGRGGWPLNVFLDHDLKPFYGGTYFPPTPRYNIPSWPELLVQLARYYNDHKDEVKKTKSQIFSFLSDKKILEPSSSALSAEAVSKLKEELQQSFDSSYGGFGSPPKFPHSSDVVFLLEQFARDKNQDALNMAVFTLEKMARGGLYDQLGGGFHRYSTDERWLIPHFEKMLYDNALLLLAYAEGFAVTGNLYFKEVCEEIVAYIKREMMSERGAFFAAQDADSEGHEGTFFVWREAHVKEIVGVEHGSFICEAFGLTTAGNFEHGTNALWLPHDVFAIGQKHGLNKDNVIAVLSDAKHKLFTVREKREKPFTDKKIITSWNGLMIAALARAGFVLKNQDMLNMAKRCADFVWDELMIDGNLYRLHTGALQANESGKAKTLGFLEDYSYYNFGLIELFLALGLPLYLQRANELAKKTNELFRDEEGVGFYFTASHHADVITRSRKTYDGATPSAQALAFYNEFSLALVQGDLSGLSQTRRVLLAHQDQMLKLPRGSTQLVRLLDSFLREPLQIVIAGNSGDERFETFVDFFRCRPLPAHRLMQVDLKDKSKWQDVAHVKEKLNGVEPTVYICRGTVCEAPIIDVAGLARRF